MNNQTDDYIRATLEEAAKIETNPIFDRAWKSLVGSGVGSSSLETAVAMRLVVEMIRGAFDEGDRDVAVSKITEWIAQAAVAP